MPVLAGQSQLFFLDLGLDPSKHKKLTPPQPPTPLNCGSLRGIEASKSKNPLGDCFVRQNNEFTRGWTSNIMPWGMLREPPPKKRGHMASAPALDLTTSLRGDLNRGYLRNLNTGYLWNLNSTLTPVSVVD